MVISDSTGWYDPGYVFEPTSKNTKNYMVVDVNVEVIVKEF